MKNLTGIITFNPNIKRLKENLDAICDQETDILIFDNGSRNKLEICSIAKERDCTIMCSDKNKGIAYGLKKVMSYADKYHYDWVLSLDQDSISEPGLIQEYVKYTKDPKIGALTCIIKDRNFTETQDHRANNLEEIDKCITSGCFMSVAAYKHTLGYDTKMFIDSVDFDICYALRAAGYKIARIPFVGLLHEVGKGFNVSVLGKQTIMYNEAAWRRYYMTRNEIYISKKYPQYQSPIKTTLRCLWTTFLVLIYENDKVNKLYDGLHGILDGIFMKPTK
ncbi:glycosyltransferase [Acidaminococcus timonensis]|uniref:glycosyltransferase n=1 Tax=Acidaminococcus timonensis TaxID=1871002 RepID=UPI00294393CD|nr:glycosyltransferase [Acidaminococcus timonensis]